MKDTVCADGPFVVEMKVAITNGENVGFVTYTLAPGKIPTTEAIKEGIVKSEEAAKEQGYRLMDRHEFIADQMGVGDIAIPGPKTFNLIEGKAS